MYKLNVLIIKYGKYIFKNKYITQINTCTYINKTLLKA